MDCCMNSDRMRVFHEDPIAHAKALRWECVNLIKEQQDTCSQMYKVDRG